MGRSGLILAGAAIAALFALKANAAQGDEIPMGATDPDTDPADDDISGDFIMPDLNNSTVDQRRAAALFMLRRCEHKAADVAEGSDYQTFYSGIVFWDMSDHPAITGEVQPVQLSAQMCINAGYADGICFSTAAGAYQITRPTWKEFRGMPGSADYLPDFTPESQDAAALRIMQKVGALALIDAGDIAGALPRLGKRWASIPGAVGKQGQRSVQFALDAFSEGLQA